jgi:hypothetical protein
MSHLWRIYCITESQWNSEWSDTTITTCPNNAGHTVNANSVQKLNSEIKLVQYKANKNITTTSFYNIYSFLYTLSYGSLRRLFLIGYMSGATSFTIQVYDTTNNIELLQYTSTNTVDNILIDCGVCTTPTTNAILNVNVKQTGGAGNFQVYIGNIILYSFV